MPSELFGVSGLPRSPVIEECLHPVFDQFQRKKHSTGPAVIKIAFLTFTPRFSTSRIGDCLINYLATTVERLVPHSTEFTVVDAIHGYGYGPVGQRRDKDTWRRLHDLIAFASWLVEHTVGVVKASAGARDRCGGIRD